MLKPWALGRAATIKSKKMGMMPRRGAIQWPRSSGAGCAEICPRPLGVASESVTLCLPKHTYLNERQRLT